ncbi:MAG TPA: HD-GYP domain-containing protein [Macromonas sp.]|nr:HD-GYP domain-containing protein [Macromonas sp.]
MLKRISIHDVRLGMYIQKFCGAWIDHPFWRSKFLLETTDDLKAIQSSAITEVWIDASRGLDVRSQTSTPPAVLTQEEFESSETQAPPPATDTRPTSMAEELKRAKVILNQARGAVNHMLNDVRMGRAIDQDIIHQVANEITNSVLRNGHAIISLVRLKTADDYTYMHSVAVCALMVALAKQLALDDETTRRAGYAGLMHDLGKMSIPMDILNKPGKLTDVEFKAVQSHPEAGHALLKNAGIDDDMVLDVCLHHHEKLDGTGYPNKLKGDQISLYARMGAVCDIYDAVTSNRPYKRGWDPAESLKRMAEWTGYHLDNRVFQAFVRSLGIYPIGSLVLLTNGRLAVVVEQSKTSLLKPIVKTVFSTKSNERVVPTVIDLSDPSSRYTILSREDPDKWKLPDLDALWSGQS